ncbi:MAG: hypothetical protein IJR89_08505 [Clostridia bacterium]|nr:hypothetical protein [Clostridia bacterium]
MKRKLLALVLLSALLLSLAACGKNPNTPSESGVPTDSVPDSGTGDPSLQEEKLEVPDKTYDDADFIVLSAGQVAYDDFSFSDESNLVLDQAQFIRKSTVEETYGVKISIVIDENKSGVGNGSGYNRISRSVNANSADYHMGLIGGMDVSTLAYSDFLCPIGKAEYIDLTKSWWDQNANKDLTVMGNIFFTQGDITASKSESTYVIFYNKELGKEQQVEDPYQLVKDMHWTLDKFSEMCLSVSEELDGNDIRDMNDRYGLYVWDDSLLGMISAAGQKIATINEDGEFELSLYNDNVVSVVEQFTKIAYNTDYAVMYQRYSNAGNVREHWMNDQALFWATSSLNIEPMRDMKSDFGILPFPMLNEEQTRYYATLPTYNSQFLCLPSVQDDLTFTSAITEALAYYGQKIVKPAVYEKTIAGTYFRDEESIEMLDIIYDSFIYDIGQLHRIGNLNSLLLNMFRSKTNTFSSIYEANAGAAERQIEAINEGYRTVIGRWN